MPTGCSNTVLDVVMTISLVGSGGKGTRQPGLPCDEAE